MQLRAILNHGFNPGTLFFFPDRLTFVGSRLPLFFGLLGYGIAAATAKGRALKGGRGVISIPMQAITSVQRAKISLNGNCTAIANREGNIFTFSTPNPPEFRRNLQAAVQALGAATQPEGEGFRIV